MGKEAVFLKDDADSTCRGWHQHISFRVIHGHAAEPDAAAGQRREPADRPQEGGLPRPVGPEDRDDLTGLDLDRDVEGEGWALDDHVGDEAVRLGHHDAAPVRNHLSRSATSTMTDTARSTRLRATASDGSPSRPM